MTGVRLGAHFAFSHPAHFIALGFGAGLLPRAPGTAGTLLAFPLWWAFGGSDDPLLLFAVLAFLFGLGVWVCGVTGRHLGVPDHGAMCWDEVVAFLLVLALAPAGPVVAGGGILPVPRLRHPEAAAGPAGGEALQGRLRRDVRRFDRGGVYAVGACDRETSLPMKLAVLARKTGTALKKKGQMLVTAESCTGGWVAQAADFDRRARRSGSSAVTSPTRMRPSATTSALRKATLAAPRRGQRADRARDGARER